MTTNGYGFFLCGDENILKLEGGEGGEGKTL